VILHFFVRVGELAVLPLVTRSIIVVSNFMQPSSEHNLRRHDRSSVFTTKWQRGLVLCTDTTALALGGDAMLRDSDALTCRAKPTLTLA
jgi:hypothetical protein